MEDASLSAACEKPQRVLIVEDEYLIADDLQRLLVANGYDVAGPVAEIDTAWSHVAQDGIDFVVLDINLDGDMSFDLATRLQGAAIPFLFLTGYDRDAIPTSFHDVTCLLKPHEPALIVETIGQHLAIAASGRRMN